MEIYRGHARTGHVHREDFMRLIFRAEEGDEVQVQAFEVSPGTAVVRLEIDNSIYADGFDFDWITFSPDRARRLAGALIAIADHVDCVNAARNSAPPAWRAHIGKGDRSTTSAATDNLRTFKLRDGREMRPFQWRA